MTQSLQSTNSYNFSDSFYQAELKVVRCPEVFRAGTFEEISVELKNTGTGFFSALRSNNGRSEVAVSYHWYDNHGKLQTWDGMRTRLQHDLQPKQTAILPVEIYTPPDAGQYHLELSLVEDGVAWFEEKGNPVTRLQVIVTSAPVVQGPGLMCSIVIPVFNCLPFTRKCLQSIERSISDTAYEVIVVNNGSSDETGDFLQTWVREGGNRQVISFGANTGFARGCNAGARLARGRYVVFLNNDTVPLPGWLEAMVGVAEADPEVGIVGSKLLYPDDRIQHLGIVFDRNKNPRHIYRGAPSSIQAAHCNREYQAVTGACLLIRRELFESVDGLDEGYRNSFEDADLCLKIRTLNKRVIFCANSTVYHFEGMSEGRTVNDARNNLRFRSRWADEIEADGERWYALDGSESDLNTELSMPEGYSARQEELLEKIFKRIYDH